MAPLNKQTIRDKFDGLTSSQQESIRDQVAGMTPEQIASRGIQESTVDKPTLSPEQEIVTTPQKTEEEKSTELIDYESVQKRKQEDAKKRQEEFAKSREQELSNQGVTQKEEVNAGAVDEKTTPNTPEETPITDISSFKSAGGGVNELSDLIEGRYGANAKIDGDTVTADIDGERFQWTIDKGGNPIKTSLGRVDNQFQVFANERGISTKLVNGETLFEPKNIDEAMDLMDQFGKGVKFTKESRETVGASAGMKYLEKYKGASTDVLLSGMKSGEIGVSGETWDRLSRMNGGEPTVDMIAAQRFFEQGLKIENINEENKIINSELAPNITDGEVEVVKTRAEQISEGIAALDAKYDEEIKKIYATLDTSFSDFKANNAELSSLNDSLNEAASQMDELEIAKRSILKEIKAKYPNMDLSTQLDLYNQRAESIDDQLFVLQRSYNADLSTYNFKTAQAQAEYEFNIGKAENKMNFIGSIYNRVRGDLMTQEGYAREDAQIEQRNAREDVIYERDIARADEMIQREIEQNEIQRKQAIIDADEERAKTLTYEKEILEAQLKLNQQYGKQFSFMTPSAGLIAKTNAQTGEVELIRTDGEVSTGTTGKTTPTATGILTDVNTGNKTVQVDSVGAPGLTSAISALEKAGIPVVTGLGHRNQTETIKQMAKDKGIPYTTAEETAQKLREAGHQVANPGMSNHESGMAIDIYGDGKLGKVSEAQEKILNENGWFSANIPGDAGHFEYKGVTETTDEITSQGLVNETINGVSTVLGSIGVPVAFERTIKNQIPATLLNSEVELKAANDVIKNLYDSGMSQEDASAIFQGFEIRNPDDIQLGANLLQISRGINNPPEGLLAKISANINVGGSNSAVNQIERAVENDMGEDAIKKADTTIQIERLNGIRDYIEEKGGPGVLGGKIENFKGKFKEEDISTLESKLGTYSTEKVVEIFGTAVTSGEGDKSGAITLSLDEKVQALYNKIDVFKQDELLKLNAYRRGFIPEINEQQLLDTNELENLYRSDNFFGNKKSVGPVSTKGISGWKSTINPDFNDGDVF